MERTFGIIKPNVVEKNLIGRIFTMIEEAGLKVVEARMEHLSKEKAEGFYAEHQGKPFFDSLVSFMTSSPVVVFAIEGENAIEKYRTLMGATNPEQAAPQTIRKLYAENIERNAVHGSDSPTSAERELNFFFGK